MLTGVFSCVSDEGRGDGERHAAQIALVRLLPGVAAFVVGQRAGLSERLTTHVTNVRLLSAVQPATEVGRIKARTGTRWDPGGGGRLYLMCIL